MESIQMLSAVSVPQERSMHNAMLLVIREKATNQALYYDIRVGNRTSLRKYVRNTPAAYRDSKVFAELEAAGIFTGLREDRFFIVREKFFRYDGTIKMWDKMLAEAAKICKGAKMLRKKRPILTALRADKENVPEGNEVSGDSLWYVKEVDTDGKILSIGIIKSARDVNYYIKKMIYVSQRRPKWTEMCDRVLNGYTRMTTHRVYGNYREHMEKLAKYAEAEGINFLNRPL